jgi:hypothetical protein
VGAEKLSISLDADLLAQVRAAANQQGVSVSTWLAEAAEGHVRQRLLREALDALAAEVGELSPDDVDRLIAQSRRNSRLIAGKQGAA